LSDPETASCASPGAMPANRRASSIRSFSLQSPRCGAGALQARASVLMPMPSLTARELLAMWAPETAVGFSPCPVPSWSCSCVCSWSFSVQPEFEILSWKIGSAICHFPRTLHSMEVLLPANGCNMTPLLELVFDFWAHAETSHRLHRSSVVHIVHKMWLSLL
jgi:hypothetical protein